MFLKKIHLRQSLFIRTSGLSSRDPSLLIRLGFLTPAGDLFTADDVEEAIKAVLPRLGADSFTHFWDDAIREEGEDQQHVSVTRRKVLLALGTCLRQGGPHSA